MRFATRWAARGSIRLGQSACGLFPTAHSTHILSALVFATQSPYSGRQNVAYSRNVMRNKKPKIYEEAPPSLAALIKEIIKKSIFYKIF
jgi:hypothetical protein